VSPRESRDQQPPAVSCYRVSMLAADLCPPWANGLLISRSHSFK
jgi:hypothetical protein